jgi:hypothetical protein
MLLLASILALQSAGAACPADATALRGDIATADGAYEDWAWEVFDASVTAVRQDLGCLTVVVSEADAAAAHRIFALAGARSRDEALAVNAFRGLLAMQPGYELDRVLAPEGSTLRSAWEQARALGPGAGQPLPEGSWFLDGRSDARIVPIERAAVVQQHSAEGELRSWYLDGGELPASLQDRLGAAIATSPPVAPVAGPEGHASRTMLLSGAALAAVGVGALFGGEALENRMMQAETLADAESLHKAGMGATFGGLGLGAAGAGLVIGAVIKGQW